MTHTYKISNKDASRPLDKVYFVVFGFVFGTVLSCMGGAMAYMAWKYEIKDEYTSLAEDMHIPTGILSIIMVALGGFLLIMAVTCLIATGCDCSKPKPSAPPPCPELASSTQVLTISRETLRT